MFQETKMHVPLSFVDVLNIQRRILRFHLTARDPFPKSAQVMFQLDLHLFQCCLRHFARKFRITCLNLSSKAGLVLGEDVPASDLSVGNSSYGF